MIKQEDIDTALCSYRKSIEEGDKQTRDRTWQRISQYINTLANGTNYEPNEVRWPAGSVVIHDADAKKPKMLMKIVGYTSHGLAQCQYIYPTLPDEPYFNEIRYLHDPAKFDIDKRHYLERLAEALETCQPSNKQREIYEIASLVHEYAVDCRKEQRARKQAEKLGDMSDDEDEEAPEDAQ